ncbi:MAG TPA: hypothetical protein VMS17_16560 [Gemmataceae bacterium]|nr:hypothetical protein [Gemmataceae bacterium]
MSSDAGKEVRDELLRLLDNDDWQVTESARSTAYPILRTMGRMPSDGAIIEHVSHLLRTDFPFHAVPLGEPPGSAGTGYMMNNADGRGLYIKMTIRQARTTEVWVVSFHVSQHFRG